MTVWVVWVSGLDCGYVDGRVGRIGSSRYMGGKSNSK